MRFLVPSAAVVVLLVAAGHGVSRPRYGGTLRVETRRAVDDSENPARALVFENLTVLDDTGKPQPKLATTWESQDGDRRWQFWLRRNIRFHDGVPLTATAVVTSFASGHCGTTAPASADETGKAETCPWGSLRAVGDSVVFEFSAPRPHFAADLALPGYAIERAYPNEPSAGTGPYRWKESRGNSIVLQANDTYWGGRPFTDVIEITVSRNLREQIVDFELGHADVIEAGPEQLRRLSKARTAISLPSELIVVAVRSAKPALHDRRLRQAIALSVDRAAIHNVVLQKQGEIAGGLLPNWMSGYAFLLSQPRDLATAQRLVREMGNVPPLTIAAAEPDPMLQLITERIALNAREAGVVIQPANGQQTADLQVTYAALTSLNSQLALRAVRERFGIGAPEVTADTPQKLYEQERSVVAEADIIPLVYVPRIYALAPRVRNWAMTPDGRGRLEDVWLAGVEAVK